MTTLNLTTLKTLPNIIINDKTRPKNQPDRCTYGGKTWRVSQTDGSGNNVWQPGVFGWTEVTEA